MLKFIKHFKRFRKIVKNTEFKLLQTNLSFSVSVGANINYAETLQEMIEGAEEALFKAKEQNKIIINS